MSQLPISVASRHPMWRLPATILALLWLLPLAGQDDNRGYRLGIGDAVPDFELLDLDGKTWSRDGLLGTPYILQFTASWCGVCRKEMPHLEKRVWQQFKNQGLQLLGVELVNERPRPELHAPRELVPRRLEDLRGDG